MDKYKYVRDAKDTGDHHCHWPGCPELVKPAFWGCKRHWYLLPKPIRDRIWAAYRPGQEIDKNPSSAYIQAFRAAIEWIEKHHPPTRPVV